ncbi:diacylglycerol/lipid kinase family protein [Cesiribacter andamanensis]|uniref:Diacylglycerol kinase n=1 Tax=Cesiribacter andamanensis AMV16 TaxID=1279009 RepID=M7N3S5_9BACT|nr:diacylglycerol kinase family protein [Cesiribacter andamanensis]EMR03313.1 Diacylglycerol kinase [Cesiribacter andamanensis AMV16]
MISNPAQQLLAALEEKGFQAHYCNYKTDDYEAQLQDPGQLVVIAGGDGTLLKVSRHLVGKGVPLAFLPLGTANNIATQLGISGPPAVLIRHWDLSRRKALDVGLMEKPGAQDYFLESAGFGLLPHLGAEHSKDTSGTRTQEAELQAARQQLLKLLRTQQADTARLVLDGYPLEGRYLLVQVMNMGYTGPRLALAPGADASDGLLDVVLVREEERQLLQQYLSAIQKGDLPRGSLPVHRAKSLSIRWSGRHHYDGIEMHDSPSALTIQFSLIPKGLEVLSS